MCMLCLHRDNGSSGDVFAVVISEADKHLFTLSLISIGHGVTIIKPQLEGYWAHVPIITTTEPILSAQTNWNPTPALTLYDKVCICIVF